MGFKKLGSPYSHGNSSGHRNQHGQSKKGGQSYMWRVIILKTEKGFFKTDVKSYGTKVFNNKVEAIKYLDSCHNSGYDASRLEKWDPTNH